MDSVNSQELAKGAPRSILSIYEISPRERCWLFANLLDLAKGAMLTFCLPVLAKGAVLDSVDLRELAKAAPRWLWSINKILPRERC